MSAVIVLYVISLLVSLAFRNELVREAERSLAQQDNATGITAETAATIGLVFTGLITLLIGVAFAVLARFVLRGRGWARITTAILAGVLALFALVGVVSSLLQDSDGGSTAFRALALVLNLLSTLCLIGIPVLLFLRPSNDYFAPRPFS